MKKFQFICGLAIVLLSFVGLAAPAWSQSEQEINGTLQIRQADGERAPAEGVIITVEGVGEAISNADGSWSVSIPEPGVYLVFVDEESLPDGVSLRTVGRSSLEIEVEAGKSKTALFSLVEGEGSAAGTNTSEGITGRRVAQLTVEGLKQGLYLAMAAVGLSLIYGTTGLVNFAHAELVTWGGLVTYFFNYYGLAGMIGFLAPLPAPVGEGSNLVFAALFGMIAGGAMGYFLDRFLFRRLRKQGVSLIAQMVITIGLSILMRYTFVYFFGGSPRSFRNFTAQSAVDIGPIQITPKDLIAMGISVVVLLAIGGILTFTRIGKAMRAVSDNRDLAESSGIDVQRVISTVWIFGGSAAALGGVFFGLDQVKWDFGFRILLLIFASVTLGGLGTAYGALVGAIVIGLVVNLSTLFIDPELKNMIALLSMVLVLMFRPQGLLGKAERIG